MKAVDGWKKYSVLLLGVLTSTMVLHLTACGNNESMLPPGPEENAVVVTESDETLESADGVGHEDSIRIQAEAILNTMSLHQRIGQLLLLQTRYQEDGRALQQLSDSERDLLKTIEPGGVILFRENMETVPQVIQLVEAINAAVPSPPFIAVDEEGGSVSRLQRSGKIPATPIPSARRIAASGDPRSAYLAYMVIGRELRALGINMNFAPVADIHSSPENLLVASRAFGSDPVFVAHMVEAAVRALGETGIVQVIKHFPGHGESSGDSHFEQISLDLSGDRLRGFELVPFAAGIEAGASGIMTAHISFPRVDESGHPASLSPVFVQTILREEMGFQGLVITDALEMKGVEGLGGPEQAGVMAIKAGADMLLIPPDPMGQRDALLMAVITGEIPEDRINQAVLRIISAKIRHEIWYTSSRPNVDSAMRILGSGEHLSMLEQALGNVE